MLRSAVRSGTEKTICWATSTTAVLALAMLAGCGSNLQPAYAIKATVSGLVGSGLELWVNGHDPKTVNASGEVTLAFMVSGYHYSVTVKTQPSNPVQTCEVANASGVMGSADVTNVTVTCVTTFAIGGTVSGLNGSGLVLHNSLGDDLSIAGNGSFVFPTRAATNTDYTVSVKTQPAAPIQTCSVGKATGTVGSANVLDVTVICSTNAFQVGGAVSGLATGTKVVLQNNGTDDREVIGGGTSPASFTFSQGVADGATYEVKVKTQPTSPWQTCTVTTGTGTIASAAVGNVSVTCTINQYAIVVNVSGLKGTGLVLQNNGGNDLAVTTNGNFAFAAHLDSGATYSMTVKMQPASPAQDCLVANGTGTVHGTDVTNISVTCHSWDTARLIEIEAGSAWSPQVAMDSTGNAIAVWQQADSTRQSIWANKYVAGSGWSTAQLIETDNAGDAKDPQVAMDSAGNAFALWCQSDGTHYNIWANRFVAGGGWGTAQLIETDNAGYAWNPQVAMDSCGNAIAVWQQSDGTRDNIWANRYATGDGWGTAQLIETEAGGAQYPQVAMENSGNAIAVWQQFDGTRDNIWTNRYVAGSGWGAAQLIETDNAGTASFPQAAMDASGNAIAVWQQSDGTHDNVWANRYEVGGGWGAAQLIALGSNYPCFLYPQVAMDPSGNAIAVWQQSDGTHDNIWANRYVVGSGWGTTQLIESDNNNARGPQVATDASGNAIAIWHRLDGIWANRYVAGSGWGTAYPIGTDNAGIPAEPKVAMDSAGNAMAIWQQSADIWANRY